MKKLLLIYLGLVLGRKFWLLLITESGHTYRSESTSRGGPCVLERQRPLCRNLSTIGQFLSIIVSEMNEEIIIKKIPFYY